MMFENTESNFLNFFSIKDFMNWDWLSMLEVSPESRQFAFDPVKYWKEGGSFVPEIILTYLSFD